MKIGNIETAVFVWHNATKKRPSHSCRTLVRLYHRDEVSDRELREGVPLAKTYVYSGAVDYSKLHDAFNAHDCFPTAENSFDNVCEWCYAPAFFGEVW